MKILRYIFSNSYHIYFLILCLILLNIVEPRPKTPQHQPLSLYNSFEDELNKDSLNRHKLEETVHNIIEPSDRHRIVTSSKKLPKMGYANDMNSVNNISHETAKNSQRRNGTSLPKSFYNHRPLNERSRKLIILIKSSK